MFDKKEYQKRYREKNKEKSAEYARLYYLERAEEKRSASREYYHSNREDRLAYAKQNADKKETSKYNKSYYKDNKKDLLKKVKEYNFTHKDERQAYRQENKTKLAEYGRKYFAARRKIDPSFNLRKTISNTIRLALKKNKTNKNKKSSLNYLPYTIDKLKWHLESLWEPWMNWSNYGPANIDKKTWQIDHIIPQSVLLYYSMEDENFKKCWALTNLRPLESIDNIKKGAKYDFRTDYKRA